MDAVIGKCTRCGESTDCDGEACPEATLCTECDSLEQDLESGYRYLDSDGVPQWTL